MILRNYKLNNIIQKEILKNADSRPVKILLFIISCVVKKCKNMLKAQALYRISIVS